MPLVHDKLTVFCPACGEEAGEVAFEAEPAEEDSSVGFAGPTARLVTKLPDGRCPVCGDPYEFDEKEIREDCLTYLAEEEQAAYDRYVDALAEDVAAGEYGRGRPKVVPLRSRWRAA